MIDTHSHLLPGIDHGCPDMQTALAMARAAAESGIGTVVCTPHYPEWDEAKIEYAWSLLNQLRVALDDAGIDLRVTLGFEVDLAVAALEDLDKLRRLTVTGSKDVILCEMPYSGWPVYLEPTIFKMSSAGMVPIIAHPERNDHVQKSSEPLQRLIRSGAIIQATAGTLTGIFGNVAIRTFHRLFSEGLVSLIATDAHSSWQENWTMEPLLRALDSQLSEDDLARLTITNPRHLMRGEPLEPVVSGMGGGQQGARRRKLWGKNQG
jgi:protein-tyrosine phosphatase